MTQLDRQGIVEVSDGGVSVELRGETMTLNIGPQHPSTHGVLRLVAEVDPALFHPAHVELRVHLLLLERLHDARAEHGGSIGELQEDERHELGGEQFVVGKEVE